MKLLNVNDLILTILVFRQKFIVIFLMKYSYLWLFTLWALLRFGIG